MTRSSRQKKKKKVKKAIGSSFKPGTTPWYPYSGGQWRSYCRTTGKHRLKYPDRYAWPEDFDYFPSWLTDDADYSTTIHWSAQGTRSDHFRPLVWPCKQEQKSGPCHRFKYAALRTLRLRKVPIDMASEELERPQTYSINFTKVIDFVLEAEGEVVKDDPDDPGGLTKWGITMNYDQDELERLFLLYRGKDGKTKQEDMARLLKSLTRDDAMFYYWATDWQSILGNQLPWPLCLALMDYRVHSGPIAKKRLQQIVYGIDEGPEIDGKIGPLTLSMVTANNPDWVARKLMDIRLRKLLEDMERNPIKRKYALGWMRRLMRLTALISKRRL